MDKRANRLSGPADRPEHFDRYFLPFLSRQRENANWIFVFLTIGHGVQLIGGNRSAMNNEISIKHLMRHSFGALRNEKWTAPICYFAIRRRRWDSMIRIRESRTVWPNVLRLKHNRSPNRTHRPICRRLQFIARPIYFRSRLRFAIRLCSVPLQRCAVPCRGAECTLLNLNWNEIDLLKTQNAVSVFQFVGFFVFFFASLQLFGCLLVVATPIAS